MTNVDTNTMFYEGTNFIFYKIKPILILPTSSLKVIIKMLERLTIYLLCLMDMFFNRQYAAFRCVPTLLLFSLICLFIKYEEDVIQRLLKRKTKSNKNIRLPE